MHKDQDTNPIVNVIKDDREAFDRYMAERLADREADPPDLSLVQVHKAKLGRQVRTWTGEFRFYIWEGVNWRVLVANGYGYSFELHPDVTTVEEAMAAWQDYRTRMGRVPV